MWLVKWIVALLGALVAVLLTGGRSPAPDLHDHALGGPRRAAGEDLRARRRSAQLAAMVGLEPARPADADRIQRSGERRGGDRWKSKSQGDGAMALTDAEPGRRIAYDLYFPDFGTISSGELRFEPQKAASKVTWTMNANTGKNPLYHWLALGARGMIGKDFSQRLAGPKAEAKRP